MEEMLDSSRQLSLFDEPTFYESVDVELKSAKGGVPGSLWGTYSSFANTNGGTIYLGILEQGEYVDVHGVSNPSKIIDNLWNNLNNRGKVSANVLSPGDISLISVSGKSVVKINVPRATRLQRPVFLNNDPMGHTFRRDHTGDYRCSPDEVRRMFADQSQEPADSRILQHYSMEDIHQPSLQQYRNRMASSNPNHPWLLEDDKGLLQKLGGWRRERSSGIEGLTVAGLLMFGKESAIKSPEALPQYQLDYWERLGEEPSQRWSDRITIDGTWEGNLFQFYNRVLPGMVKTLKAPFQMDANHYRFDETSVGGALREAVVNSLIHADYGGQGGVVMDRFGDRFELSNPGSLLISHEQMLKGGISECRNKSLQLMFQLMGAGDKAGSGMDKIRTSWESARFRAPRVGEISRPDRVTLTLPMVSIMPDRVIESLSKRFGAELSILRPEEIQILVMAQEEGEITNVRLQEVLTAHRTDLTKTLQQLVRNGFLQRAGIGRWTRYELPTSIVISNDGSERIDTSSDTSSDTRNDASNDASNDTSFDGSPLAEDAKPFENGHEEHDPAIWSGLLQIAAPARGKRITGSAARQIVLLLLSKVDQLTSAEFGELLQRDSANFRARILQPMVTDRLIKARYPNTRHPYQSYSLADPG